MSEITLDNVTYKELLLKEIVPNPWNPNVLNAPDMARLETSMERFNQVENIVVREKDDGKYEIIGGEHRWKVLRKMKKKVAICAVVELEKDEDAMLLGEALNQLHGAPDKAKNQTLYEMLKAKMPVEQIMSIIPKTTDEIAGIIKGMTGGEPAAPAASDSKEYIDLKISVKQDQMEVIQQAFEKIAKDAGITQNLTNKKTRGSILEWLAADFLAGAPGDES